MAITFHPKAGMVPMCDFTGSVPPEIGKQRPVIGYVCHQDLVAICYSVNVYFGIDPEPFRE